MFNRESEVSKWKCAINSTLAGIIAMVVLENVVYDFKNDVEKIFTTLVVLIVAIQYAQKITTTILKHSSVIDLLHRVENFDEKKLFALIKKEKKIKVISRFIISSLVLTIMLSWFSCSVLVYICSYFVTGPEMPWIVVVQVPGTE